MNQLFALQRRCPRTGARAGTLTTPHGSVPTPAFAPVGSQGTVKTLAPDDLRSVGATIVLGNSYHLYLRPGLEVIDRLGGLHQFMAWDGPLLTDSGGFQVLSLKHLRRVSDEGVLFRSHIDGSEHFLVPERAVELQEGLGADIIMAFDECPPYGESLRQVRLATERTHRWARRCQRRQQRQDQALFAIVQGGTFAELRRESAAYLASLDFPGYGIGGLSLGESKELTQEMVAQSIAPLPEDRPRYLMGVGSPEDLVTCVALGIDLFDSALPTRVARNGALFTHQGRRNIRNACFRQRQDPVDHDCDCYTCGNFSAAYLHHLFKCEELLGYRLATIHNLRFILKLMEDMRQAILGGDFPEFRDSFLSCYQPTDEEVRAEQKS
ncbi:tRNA guanosine(34) transglycosylase Tgt, partial [Chloroflexota bacterium]